MFGYVGDGRRTHRLVGPMYDEGLGYNTRDDSIRHVATRPGAGRFPNEDDTHYGQHSGRSRRQEAEPRGSYSYDDDETADAMFERRLAALRGGACNVRMLAEHRSQPRSPHKMRNDNVDEAIGYTGRRDADGYMRYREGDNADSTAPRREHEPVNCNDHSRDMRGRSAVQRHASAYVMPPEAMRDDDATYRLGMPHGRPSSCTGSDSRVIIQQRADIAQDRCQSSMAIGQRTVLKQQRYADQLKREYEPRPGSAFRPIRPIDVEARRASARESPPRMVIRPHVVPAHHKVEQVVEANPFHTMRNPGWSPGKQRLTDRACSSPTMDQEMRGLTKADVCHCHGTYRHDLFRRDTTPECTDFDDVDRMSMALAVRRRYPIEQEAQPQPVRRSKRVADKQESANKGARQSECVPAKQKDQTSRKQSDVGGASHEKGRRSAGKEPVSRRTKATPPPSDESDVECDLQYTEAKPPAVGDEKRRCRGAGDGDKQGGKEPPKKRANEDSDGKAENSQEHDAGESNQSSKRGAQSGGPPDDDPSDDSSSDDEHSKKPAKKSPAGVEKNVPPNKTGKRTPEIEAATGGGVRRGGAKGQHMKPPKFTGINQSIDTFLSQFNTCAKYNRMGR